MRRILSVSAVALLLAPALALATDFTLSGKNTTITFVGTKPEGKHEGGFKTVTGKASVDKDDVTTLKVSVEIDTTTLYSDNEQLTKHLKSPDFFGVKSNPKAKFVSIKVEKDGDNYKVTGDFTMLGKTKSITFPATISAKGDDFTLTSSFSIDRTEWGMNFGKGKIDNAVKLTVNVKTK